MTDSTTKLRAVADGWRAQGDSFTRSRAAAELDTLTASLAQGDGVDELMVEKLAYWLCERDGVDPHQLIWQGQPPEPWGEVRHRYAEEITAALTERGTQ